MLTGFEKSRQDRKRFQTWLYRNMYYNRKGWKGPEKPLPDVYM